MNANHKLNSLDHATVEDLMAADFGTDHATVERHLAETKAASAAISTDPYTAMRVDAAIAAAEDELGLDDSAPFIGDTDQQEHSPDPTLTGLTSRIPTNWPGHDRPQELRSRRPEVSLGPPPTLRISHYIQSTATVLILAVVALLCTSQLLAGTSYSSGTRWVLAIAVPSLCLVGAGAGAGFLALRARRSGKVTEAQAPATVNPLIRRRTIRSLYGRFYSSRSTGQQAFHMATSFHDLSDELRIELLAETERFVEKVPPYADVERDTFDSWIDARVAQIVARLDVERVQHQAVGEELIGIARVEVARQKARYDADVTRLRESQEALRRARIELFGRKDPEPSAVQDPSFDISSVGSTLNLVDLTAHKNRSTRSAAS